MVPKYEESEIQANQRRKVFTYHAPQAGQPDRYSYLRGQAAALAIAFNEQCPPSRELSLAMTKLEEAIMWANAAIARNEAAPEPQ